MGREIRRVPLDFDWPLDKVWQGFLSPDRFEENPCPADCGNGLSPRGRYWYQKWYGHIPFHPSETGSTPFTVDTPEVRAFAERNVAHSPGYYGSGELAVRREAQRLLGFWNGMWCHHLDQQDVEVLVAAGRLLDFTHTFTRKTRWQPKDPPVVPTADEVNRWSLGGIGHDAINAFTAIEGRCQREGVPYRCQRCDGHGSVEAYEGQRAEAEAWEEEDPPTGEGWQLWETVTEGSPITPVFATAEELATYLASPSYDRWGGQMSSYEAALQFVRAGWAPSFVSTPETGVVSGAEFVGTTKEG